MILWGAEEPGLEYEFSWTSEMDSFEILCRETIFAGVEPLDLSRSSIALEVLEIDGEVVQPDDEGNSGSKERWWLCRLSLWYLLCT